MASWEPVDLSHVPIVKDGETVRFTARFEVSPREREDQAVRDRREFDSDDYPVPDDGKEQDAE